MTKPDKALATLATALSDPPQSFLPADAPFDDAQRMFLDGMLAGLAAAANAQGPDAPAAKGTALRVLFGSQTGTAEALSKDLRKFSATKGFDAVVSELDAVAPADLVGVNHLLIVAATTGEGEPCDNAKRFHTALLADDAPDLPATLHYSVCGLGDVSYPAFNQSAQEIDERLAALGATRVREPALCDVAYEDDYAAWKTDVFASSAFADAAGAATALETASEDPEPTFTKARPFTATVLDVRRLSGTGAGKVVNHVEIALVGGGPDLDYRAGDALGLWPVNDPAEVSEILAAAGFTGAEAVSLKSGPSKLRTALMSRFDLVTVTPTTRQAWAAEDAPAEIHVIDLLRAGVPELSPQVLVDGLRPLQSRLYSISSSPEAHPGEVHLTVGELRYDLNGTERKGCASSFLGGRVQPGSTVGVFVQRAAHFHPPSEDRPLIMIGPGTGIAPFRAFLEERAARSASGDNWLFFGDRTEARDYLYREQVEGWRDSGMLTRLSLAWSRDGMAKVYVQDLIQRDAAEFFAWLERGAAIYVCGDASRMAADVDRAIHEVVAQTSGMSEDAAADYVDALVRDHRYRRDVY
ncbi:sulfite reductase (NADPH) flavoprotein alpha-component [Palleronia aestuarii]|uniref:assimilatory sulfite reductase (NADPH) n=1 Tax=Palleronia aestuarii TaxID=568105 RepID=A0A2W7MPJ4_9RHOB|nr:flavodoxin domain-containing protein [Palleronia aestuarii]PZX10115.1 sulfite reductase (NADPH) flavoprotein alpha-component [Palleronia aestuarii]